MVASFQFEETQVERLREQLQYPIKQRDPQGSRFWLLRPGKTPQEAEETCPIAVGFDEQLNESDDKDLKRFLTSQDQEKEIRGHYTNRMAEEQPVMYLLMPTKKQGGKVAFILPTESRLRQRCIQTFDWNDQELQGRLGRLKQDSLDVYNKFEETVLNRVPQVDWIFYKSAKTAKELAIELANVTRQIEQVIPKLYQKENKDGYLHKLLESFKKELLPNLQVSSDNEKDYSFADIYAQTIAYGLFTARIFSHVKNERLDFNRQTAWKQLPETNPFLRQLFKDISEKSYEQLGDELLDAISAVVGILRAAKMDAILSDFCNNFNREDIVIRFYEDFLAAYKPQMRERRGVYYTPEPVVSYIVRSIDDLVKDKFNKPLGLADPEVMILDPCLGTGTFVLYIFQLIYRRFQESPEALTEGLADKSWSGYVSERLLPRIFGFELLMAPYAIAHLKLGLFLEETGYQFNSGKRLGVYLINTLEDIKLREEKQQLTLDIPQMEEIISKEAKAGSRIKKTEPIMVITGNPPYSGHSENNNEWIRGLVNDYYFVDGKPLGERNPKYLQDDYVKFIRFAQWRIDKSGQGILAFITNHGFLDNPTFRGMRRQLINSFEGISLYDLHGNIKKKEICPDGSKNENVFDIQQGVSICFAVKGKDKYLNHANLYGLRTKKYEVLSQTTIKQTLFKTVNPQREFYLLIPQDVNLWQEYNGYYLLNDIFINHVYGVKTHRDDFAIDFERNCLKQRIEDLLSADKNTTWFTNKYNLKNWEWWQAQNQLNKQKNIWKYLDLCSYRPFDNRYIFYSDLVVDRARPLLKQHIFKKNNLCLVCSRQVSGQKYYHSFVANLIPNDCLISNITKESNHNFPLYLYPDFNEPKEFKTEKRPNLSAEFLKILKSYLGYLPTPEAIFYYIYAVFHSPTYRTRYAEFLKIDFPRVPLTSNNELFTQLSNYGGQLIQLHLMESPLLNNLITQFIDNGGNREVTAGHPKYKEGKVYINKMGYFSGVPEDVWNFYVGGYQVCQKWLKDRKGRILSDEDINHYQKIMVALQETMKLMSLIDEAIPSFPI